MPSITVKIDLTDEFLRDVMVTMVESGNYCIWYWGACSDIRRMDDHRRHRGGQCQRHVDEFFLRESENHDDDHLEPHSKVVNKVEVAKAIERILNGTVPVASDIVGYIFQGVTTMDAGDIDATAADCIAQAILFDELVYG